MDLNQIKKWNFKWNQVIKIVIYDFYDNFFWSILIIIEIGVILIYLINLVYLIYSTNFFRFQFSDFRRIVFKLILFLLDRCFIFISIVTVHILFFVSNYHEIYFSYPFIQIFLVNIYIYIYVLHIFGTIMICFIICIYRQDKKWIYNYCRRDMFSFCCVVSTSWLFSLVNTIFFFSYFFFLS